MKLALTVASATAVTLWLTPSGNACDLIQLATQFIGFYQSGPVRICKNMPWPMSDDSAESYDCTHATAPGANLIVTQDNDERAKLILAAVKVGDGGQLKYLINQFAALSSLEPLSLVRQYIRACPEPVYYVQAGRNAVSCYRHDQGQSASLSIGNPSPPEAQAIGLQTCLLLGQ
jgi:hypothetical protein